MASPRSEAPRRRRHTRAEHQRRQLSIAAAILGGLVLVIWPLQAILAAILIGSSWILTLALGVWIERTVEAGDRDTILARLPQVAGVLVAVAVVLSFVWPMTMAGVTLLLAVAAAGGMGFLTWVERQVKAEAQRDDSTDAEVDAGRRRAA